MDLMVLEILLKTKIQELAGGRKDYKIDCLAADFKDWEISWDDATKDTFNEYYKYYLTLHTNKWTRRMHVLGAAYNTYFYRFCNKSKAMAFIGSISIRCLPVCLEWTLFFLKKTSQLHSQTQVEMAKVSDWIMFKDWILGEFAR